MRSVVVKDLRFMVSTTGSLWTASGPLRVPVSSFCLVFNFWNSLMGRLCDSFAPVVMMMMMMVVVVVMMMMMMMMIR